MLLIIIGLPCSGKTFLSKKYELEGFSIYDDYISEFYNKKLLAELEEEKNICINDPRLCFFPTFIRHISIFLRYTNDIELILFENDNVQCLSNLEEFRSNHPYISRLRNSIINFSKTYIIENYKKYDITCRIIPVYKKNSN